VATLKIASINPGLLNKPILEILGGQASADQSAVSSALGTALQTALQQSAANAQQTALANLLDSLKTTDLVQDQNLSVRDFVSKNTTLPSDPVAKREAETAIATLSSTTTVGALLGLSGTIAGNPILAPVVAQTNLSSLLSTSSALSNPQLQADFINLYSSFQGTPQDLWNQLGQNAEFKSLIPQLQFTMQLGVLTLNNPALVTAIQEAYKPASTRDLTKISSAAWTQLITSKNISISANIPGSTPSEQVANYVSGIMGLLQSAFPTDYVAQGLAGSADPVQQACAKFLANSSDFDFQTTGIDAYVQQNSAKAFQNIPQNQIASVTTQLKRFQRVFRIVNDYPSINTLVSAGLDSASKISSLSRSNFVASYSKALGGSDQALAVYTTASHINAQTVNAYRIIQSGIREPSPSAIASIHSTLPQTLETAIPNWQTLFGSTSYCECEDCTSVYSAAAYFVDLLQFLRAGKPNAAGFTPLDILIGGTHGQATTSGRRPDLPFIKLNCQDSETPLPYIDLINEILESYIVLGGKLDQTTAHSNPSSATADELSVNPEYTLDAAYTAISAANYPLSLPYDRFLDVARRYLAFLGGNRFQVLQNFQTLQAPVDTPSVLAAEALGLSYQEFQLIAGWDYLGNKSATLPALYTLYGYSGANVTRTEGSTTTTQSWEQWVASVPEFLERTGLAFNDLVSLLETQFINPGQTITLSGSSSCDISQTTITPLSDATLTRILPFIRLWQKLGWAMSDLDKTIAVLGPSGINRSFLLALADMKTLQTSLNLQIAEILSLWGNIDTDGRSSLYVTLFQNKAVLNPVDTNLQLGYRAALTTAPVGLPASSSAQITYDAANQQMVFAGAMTDDQWADLISWAGADANKLLAVQNLYQMRWAKGTELSGVTSATPPTITAETPAILAALRISADDLNAIRTATNLVDPASPAAPMPATLNNLTALYRYAVLAQALGLSIADLISLIQLTGIQPFQLASTDPITRATTSFVQAAQSVLASRFSVAQLNFIYRAVANPASSVGPLEVNVDLLIMTIQTALEKIVASNAFSPDPSGKLLRQKLGVLLGASDLAQAMDLISRNGVYKAGLVSLPGGVSFTGALAGLISYDGSNEILQFSGPMTDSVKAQLLLLSMDGPYQSAVNNLYQQPRSILANDLAFLDQAQGLANLINAPLADVGDRYTYVLQNLLTYLIDTQSKTLIKQTISENLGLDAATTSSLLTGGGPASPALLDSQRDATQPAIQDFLDVSGGGLLATYFSDVNLTVATSSAIAATVNVGAPGQTVPNPGGARWVGKLLPAYSESYIFYVTANDGVRLWIDDQLLIDQWSNHPLSTRTTASVNLIAGQLYDIRLDYYNASATATGILGWSSQSTTNNQNELIPATALFPANAFTTLIRLYPIALLLGTFVVKSDEVAYLSSHGADFTGTDPNNSANTVKFDLTLLPVDRTNASVVDQKAAAFFNQWQHLNDLFALRKTLPTGNVSLFDVFRTASNSTTPTQLSANTVATVLAATGWNPTEFATLSGKVNSGSVVVGFGLTDADFRNAAGLKGTGLVWLKSCLDLCARLGISASQFFLWANNPVDADQAQDIKNTVKAKYDESTWVTIGKPLNDGIRDDSKAALIAYVLNMPSIQNLGLTDPDNLYEFFLIDVQMSSCMMTSRIVQATAAVQLFIQRCLLNLEDNNTGANSYLNISPDAIDAGQWEWRKNYRVWEANREVFLYPENWIDPTLRDDRTPFFEDLQTELQQGPVTAESAENAIHNYLKKVQEVARLEICGTYWEHDADSTTGITHNILHVFGRTFASPHNYYYRNFDNTQNIWSAWEPINADIEGDHLIPVIWNRRLHLFWPRFKEQTTPNTASSTAVAVPPVSSSGSTGSAAQPQKDLQVQLAWSEYRNGDWTKKQITPNYLTPVLYYGYTADFNPADLLFSAVPNDEQLTISVWDANELRSTYGDRLGTFTFGSCSSIPATNSSNYAPPIGTDHWPPNTTLRYEQLREISTRAMRFSPPFAGTLTLVSGNPDTPGPVSDVPVLLETPTAFTLSYPQQFFPTWEIQAPNSIAAGFTGQPFFYADDQRTYFVAPWFYRVPIIIRNPINAIVVYSPGQLTQPADVSAVSSLPIFATDLAAQSQPKASSASVAAVSATASSALSPGVSTASVIGSQILPGIPKQILPWTGIFWQTISMVDFYTHRHPHICDFLKGLSWQGVPGLLTLANQQLDLADVDPNTIFQNVYHPSSSVSHPFPSEDVDFSPSGAYSIYNWEIFFHIPFLIATQLSQNQQFDDAEKWFRYIFNPTSNSTDPVPSRYWNVLPFYQDTEPDRISDLITALQYTGTDPVLLKEKDDFSTEISQWEQTPFDPDLIARTRIVAYQKAVVMKYLDHHMRWGDQLYSQFEREQVNEATLHYVLCQELLGAQPVAMPPQGVVLDQTYNSLVAAGLDTFSDALVAMENLFPFSTSGATSSSDGSGSGSVATVALVPYFCVPPNDTLLLYWTNVEKRLNQIRHCMNLAGQVEELPLFAPPINPGLLIQALAMGMDLSSALSDINAATPYYRFSYLLPKALELCSEVRSLGEGLLAALEKSDAEALAMLRATQESAVMKAVRNVKQQQLNDATANAASLNDALQVATARQQYYQGLVNAGLNAFEQTQVSLLNQARQNQTLSQQAQILGAEMAILPNIDVGVTGVGGSPTATIVFGGAQLAAIANFVASHFNMIASMDASSANIAALQGGWDRRNQEWNFQAQAATLDITQIKDQIQGANARVAMAQADLDDQDLLISNASDIQDFLRTKYTNQAIYDWMVSQVSAVYFQCYQMAYDLAKRAEACFLFERMPNSANYVPFIQFGYWDSLKKGLLCAERLYQDLKRLEIAYMDQNPRDLEISKSISLLLLDPMALINLKETGQCTVQFPEALFDADYPGHYLRRIKSLSLTIPCVVGPYTSVNCTLTLAGNKIRVDSTAADSKDYVKASHFVTNLAASQSIATSTCQNDSGLFVVNFADERYLPFEGDGAISTWQLSMPQDTNAFDFETITDVIFNLKYTGRDGGASLRSASRGAALLPVPSTPMATPPAQVAIPAQTSATRMFSLRHEFPSDWYNFLNSQASSPDLSMTLNLTQERFPFRYRGRKIQIYQLDLFLIFRDLNNPAVYTADGTPLGDYAAKGAAGALVLSVTPPGGTAKNTQLLSNTALLQRVPYGTVPQTTPPAPPPVPPSLGSVGAWTISVKGTDIQNLAQSLQIQVTSGASTFHRIDPKAVEDLVVVCHFATN
jgi:Tc toxin complex TcA C-terminal TcB-binding domain/ABC toxin N-terminal region/Neuraminidase-like domain/PA14 domain